MWACLYGRVACVAALLQGRADPNRSKANGWNALRTAQLHGRHKCAELLKEAGAIENGEAAAVVEEDEKVVDGVFRLPEHLERDQAWMERPVRSPSSMQHTYRVESGTLTYANLLQVILRYNGMERVPSYVGQRGRRRGGGRDGGGRSGCSWLLLHGPSAGWRVGSLHTMPFNSHRLRPSPNSRLCALLY